jgi:hypothetical protein
MSRIKGMDDGALESTGPGTGNLGAVTGEQPTSMREQAGVLGSSSRQRPLFAETEPATSHLEKFERLFAGVPRLPRAALSCAMSVRKFGHDRQDEQAGS